VVKDNLTNAYFVEKTLMVSIDFQKKLFTNELTVHPKLINRFIIKFIEQVGEHSFLMEYASYGNFDKVIASSMDEKERLKLLLHAARGLEYLHASGYVHNDIKPSNILVTGEFRAKLSDFAFCGRVDTVTFENIPSYFCLGTEFFRPPGEMTSYLNCISNDIYAMGKVMYLLFTGVKQTTTADLNSIPSPKIRGIVSDCLNGSYVSISSVIHDLEKLLT